MFSNDSTRIIDGMLIPVCKFARAYFSKSFKDIASYEYCASKKETYFDLKLHALVTIDGFISDFFLTSTGIDDRLAIFELRENKLSLKRKNSKNPLEKQLRNVLSKTRRRIETSFSQLAD